MTHCHFKSSSTPHPLPSSSSMGKGHTPLPPATEMQVKTVSAGCDAKVAAVAALKAAQTLAVLGRPQSEAKDVLRTS